MRELFDAIRRGDVEAVAGIADSNPEALADRENGVTPLLAALYHGKRDVAAVIAARTRLSLHEAAAFGDAARVDEELGAGSGRVNEPSADGFPPLGLAIFFGQADIARSLIERGADVNAHAQNAMRVTPLHAAAAVGNRELVALLLARGADANARQQNDYTAMHTAAQHGDIEMAEMLWRHGADLDVSTADGQTPHDFAASANRAAFLDWLSDARAKVRP